MGRTAIETIMGAVVLGVAATFLAFAWSHARFGKVEGYEIRGTFASVGGLEAGADVKINGIKVGTVLSQSLDPRSFDAVVRMSITPSVRLPTDTVASISSEGLLGGKFVKLTPGTATAFLPAGGSLGPTRSFKSLEQMVGELIFLATSDNAKPATPAPAPAPEPATPTP
ncbi:MlaD family protein [Phaeospirillum tilakii]|uniref:MlaD family protein n=1 Tax=Phaeospirillum tilakii TaxID=741673 RepID=A0ABW5CA42_9PROT